VKVATLTLGELEPDFVLAPERHVTAASAPREGVALGELVVERRERIEPRDGDDAIVIDTTHARDGVLDVAGALRDAARNGSAKSAKKRAREGDVLVSRLRPYLRQIAFVHPDAGVAAAPLAVSTEFYVLAPRTPGDDLAWLVPFLLSTPVQEALAAAQEGGHHPRVPRASLLALRVPDAVRNARESTSEAVRAALSAIHRASGSLRALVAATPMRG